MRLSRPWAAALGTAALALGFGLYTLLSRPPSVKAVSAEIENCIIRQDGPCLYRHLMRAERQAYGATPESLTRLLKEYVEPSFRGASWTGTTKQEDERLGMMLTTRESFMPEGRLVSLDYAVYVTDEGVKAPNLITTLILSCASARHARPGDEPGGVGTLRRWYRQATDDAGLLTDLGFAGVYRSAHEGFMSWDAWQQLLRERLQRAERSH